MVPKLELRQPTFVNEQDVFRTLTEIEGEATVRLATRNGHDVIEARITPHTPINQVTLRYCGPFTDYNTKEGATRPSTDHEWALTLIEASASEKGKAAGRSS